MLAGATAAAAIAWASTGAAAPAAVKLRIGDAIAVEGTSVACYALVSSGKPGVGCLLLAGSAPKVGTYGVGIAVDGTVVVNRVRTDGSAERILKRTPKRTVQARGRVAGKVYSGTPGDEFILPIARTQVIACRVVEVKPGQAAPLYQGIKVACWRAEDGLPIPGSEGVQVSERFAAAYRFDARGQVEAMLLVKRQP